MTRGEQAEQLFLTGYNCPQSVALAFADRLGIEKETLARMVSPFGGGCCRMREICGAASGMMLILGLTEGYADPTDGEGKAVLYAHGQQLLRAFAERNGKGSYICADILAKPRAPEAPIPEARTAGYYQKRPCAKIVRAAAEVLAEYLGE